MRIEHYSFGKIVISGQTYAKDVIIFPDRVLSPWWRTEGHLLRLGDLTEALREMPEVLVSGKGYSGEMDVPDGLVQELEGRGIRVLASNTAEAVGVYNILNITKKIAALHLTC